MEKIDLSTNSKKIKEAYEKVVRGDPSSNYVVYTVDRNSSLEVSESGDGSLDEFIEHFEDGSVQFGLARVIVPGSDVSKNLLVGWCPNNAPAKSRLSFANNFADVSNAFSGYHVQVTARDQDDLDAEEFLHRVCAAAGARYSTQASSKPAPKPAASKPVVAKSSPKPAFSKPSVPKSTGKPLSPITPKPTIPKPAAASSNNDDGWGDEKEIEERDFEKKPLENVPSAYKPTKVDISELRKQKSDTISSQPNKKPFASQDKSDETSKDDDEPKSLSDRMKSFKSSDTSDGRLTSLPKPKVNHSVASRFSSANTSSKSPSFGSKPTLGYGSANDNKKDKLVGGLSRNYAAEGGKTPAQLWAEKRGQYKSVKSEEDKPTQNETSELADKFSKSSIDDHEEDSTEETEEPALIKPSTGGFPVPPKRSLPPRVDEPEEEQEEEQEEHEEEEDDEKPVEPPIIKPSTGAFPTPPKRNLPPRAEEPEEEEEEEEVEKEETKAAPVPSLPARNLPPPPARTAEPKQEDVAPTSKHTEEKSEVITAVAEYDYEKDEDNEIEFAEGDLITEIEFVDEEWWSGKHSTTGDVGLFPASYVSLQNDSGKEASTTVGKTSAPETSSTPSGSADANKGPSATAEYDYEKDEDNEISFAEGDKIVEIEFIDEDWWSGKHSSSGEVGLFPANYVKLDQ